jgi:hypothetical protein
LTTFGSPGVAPAGVHAYWRDAPPTKRGQFAAVDGGVDVTDVSAEMGA